MWRRARALLIRLLSWSSPRTLGRQQGAFADELESHLQMHIDDLLRRGMDPRQARREAILKSGGLEMTKQSYRERSTVPILDDLIQDLRFAFRQLVKNPGFGVTVTLMLALGMGASVAIFAFVDAALLKPLPYPNPERLASVTETVALFGRANLSYPDYLDWRRMSRSFSTFAIYGGGGGLLKTPTGALPIESLRVTDEFFRTLSVAPIMGRDFYAGEDLAGTADTVILSYNGWQKWFQGRADIVGQKVTLDSVVHTVIGVMPQGFVFAPRGGTDFWTPFHAKGDCDLRRSCHGLIGVARLKHGVSMGAARAEMQSVAAELERQYPGDNRGQGASVELLSEVIVGDLRPILYMLLGGAGLLLMIACVNVSSLLLVRSEGRMREIAVRGALGASPVRMIRQFFTEGIVLVAAGSLLGLALAEGTIRILLSLIPKHMFEGMPFLIGLGLSWHVLAFAAVICVFAVLLFAMTPVLRLRSTAMRDGLTEGSRGSAGTLWRRFGANLVVLELAIAVVLLVGAGLLGKSFYRLLHVDLNFAPDHLALVGISAPKALYPNDADYMRLQKEIISRVTALPGVKSAGMTSVPPVSFNGNTDWIRFVGRPYNGVHNEVNERDITADYIQTLQTKLLEGRVFTEGDDAAKPKVTIINQALAKMYFPNQDPIGQRFGNTDLDPKSIKEIVGVVADIKEGSLDSDIWPAAYYPLYQNEDNFFTMTVRTAQAEGAILPTLVSTIHSIDPGVGTTGESTMEEQIHESPTAYVHRSCAWLVSGFASLALMLGVVGLYGVIAYSVSQRTREIGVRMALGAPRWSVTRMVIQEAGKLTIFGVGLGLICAVGVAKLAHGLLFGTAAWDFATLASVASVLGVSALLASFIPAHRAASVNPVEALRAE